MKDGLKPGPPRGALVRTINRADARVLERFAPVFVVVEADGTIIQYSSRTGRFLEPAPGLPTQNVLDMARHGLRAPLRIALKQSVETGCSVESGGLSFDIPGENPRRIVLTVEPLGEREAVLSWLIVFGETILDGGAPRTGADAAIPLDSGADPQLRGELRDTREQLQLAVEEHETAVEELRGANEELRSLNEELQSSNEELETSKEEIQLMNEALRMVNGQLAGKVDELTARNTDLRNLFESTRVATVFLDSQCGVRGFTPAVTRIYNLIPGDIGRPLHDITSQLRHANVRDDVRQVLDTLEPLERRVGHEDGTTHYLMRVLPYRTPESTVDGVVVTFADVSTIALAERHQRLLVDELNHRVRNMLTVVISMASQTMRRARTMEDFSRDYIGRVHALAAAYTLLSNEAWKTVSLRDVVMEEIRPFLLEDRIDIAVEKGPLVALDPRAALALGMAVHELTTNAMRHGALSVPEGRVTLTWSTVREEDKDMLLMEWNESGGPRVIPPASQGFGLLLIKRGLSQDIGAEVAMVFAVEGVRAKFRVPLPLHSSTDTFEG